MSAKADYVKSQRQTRPHTCRWPGCGAQVPPAMWGCHEHWFRLPPALRWEIWREYRPGQERDGKPSAGYVAAAARVREWIREHGA